MATDRSQLTRQQQQWIDTIEADPDLFLALAEESGLADRIRQRLNELQGQPNDDQRQPNNGEPSSWQLNRTLQQRTDQRNALARAIVQNARGAGIHDAPAPNADNQNVRMVDLVRLAHELGSRAIQGNQAIRARDSLTEKLYEAGLAAGLVDAIPNPESSQTLQTMDAHKIIDGLSQQAESQQQTQEQRDRLATAIAEAAKSAGVVRDDVDLTGPQLLLLLNDLGLAAKQTVGRNEMLARMEASGDRIITDADAMEAIKRLDKSYYRRWREDTLLGDDKQGYVSGNIQAGDLALVVEYARHQLLEPNSLNTATTTTTNDPEPLLEWWSHLQDDYQKYASGDPSVPFSSFRQTLDQFMGAAQATDLQAMVLHAQMLEAQTVNEPQVTPEPPANLSALQRTAINHAMDVLSKHGNGFTSPAALEVLGNLLKESDEAPARVPEVTDNIMRKANRAIKELTGNAHIGVTAKVIGAIWDAMNEDASPPNALNEHPARSLSTDTRSMSMLAPNAKADEHTLNQWLNDDEDDEIASPGMS